MRRILRSIIGPLITRFILMLAYIGNKTGILKLYQPIPELGLAMDKLTPRNLGRLEAIRENIPKGSSFGMDIGCNIGYFIFEIAKDGFTLLGIEGELVTYRILNAAKNKLDKNNVLTMNSYITPDNIHCLPEVDFVICMAVFHHWCVAYGEKTALKMLGLILGKCRKALFFEPPFAKYSSDRYRFILPDRDAENPEEWWLDYFVGLGHIDVKRIYQTTSGSRMLFLIKP